ncbi:MAG: type II secretion system protein [Candidatus Omnitrophota bacterium]
MSRKGFTLIEILTAITILAALMIIAFTSFNKTKYKNEKNQAIVYLRAIRTAEKLYWGSWKTYAVLADKAAINTTLGVEIQSSWTFAVTVPTSTTFTATATSDAASGSKTITLNQDGTWGGSYTPLPSV